MIFEIAKNSMFLQNLVVKFRSGIHPSIQHNLEKIEILKKAFFHCELEDLSGSYFEFGVFEGTSLYAATQIHRSLKSKFDRRFYGFDSFDDGFKYFDEKDRHPFFKAGDFKSSYAKVQNRFKNIKDVHLIKGYFEESVQDKNPESICGQDKCAVIFIDCDLMNPALVALRFIKPLLQQGSMIILDDYWAYKGSEELGTCGALNRFLSENSTIKVRSFNTYGYGGHSFVVSSFK